MEAPNVAFFVASLQSEVRGTKVTNFYEDRRIGLGRGWTYLILHLISFIEKKIKN